LVSDFNFFLNYKGSWFQFKLLKMRRAIIICELRIMNLVMTFKWKINPLRTRHPKVDASWSTLIVTLKITTFGISFKLSKWNLTSFLSTPFEKSENFGKLKELLKLKAPCVKIQKSQFGVFFIRIYTSLNEFLIKIIQLCFSLYPSFMVKIRKYSNLFYNWYNFISYFSFKKSQ